MSAYDKLRSFAESREHDAVIIRDGLTYQDAREAANLIERQQAEIERLRSDRSRWATERLALWADIDRLQALGGQERTQADRGEKFEVWYAAATPLYGVPRNIAWAGFQAGCALSEADRRDAEKYRVMLKKDMTATYSDFWFAKLNYTSEDMDEAEKAWDAAIDAGRV